MRRLFYASIVAGFLVCLGLTAHAADDSQDGPLIKIGIADNNFFFNSILDRLMHLAGLDYVPINQPFNRSVWALTKGQVHLIGPYSSSMMGEYALSSGFPIDEIEKIPVSIDKIPMFGIYQDDIDVRQSFRDDPDISMGILRQHSVSRFHQSQKVIQAKNIKQLVNLLLAKRVDFILTPKQIVDEIIVQNPDSGLRITPRPLYFEATYLYYSKRFDFLKPQIKQALEKLSSTPIYQTLWEQFSHETSWQDD